MRSRLLSLTLVGLSLTLAAPAAAITDCPPGSIPRSENGFDWCEPTVCQTDGQCSPNEVCRPIALCMQVGAIAQDAATLGEAGKRLVVTQRCAPDKKCPDTTTCSDMGRCITKTAAEKMGLLNAPAASASAAPGGEAKKSSCGCDVPGTALGSFGFVASLAAIAGVTARRMRRSRRSR